MIFIILCLALAPLFVKAFLFLSSSAGLSVHPLVVFLTKRFWIATGIYWAIIIIGTIIALPTMIKFGFFTN
ncbi:MAG: hypothetical protein AAB386_04210 [Patescibacteria group bacterium]